MWADGQSSAMPDQSSEVPDPLLLLHTRCPSNNLPTNSSLSLETHLGFSFTGVIHLLHVLWPLGCSRLPLLGTTPFKTQPRLLVPAVRPPSPSGAPGHCTATAHSGGHHPLPRCCRRWRAPCLRAPWHLPWRRGASTVRNSLSSLYAH